MERNSVIVVGTHGDITVRYVALIVGGQHQILSALTLEADVDQRHIPSVFDSAIKLAPLTAGGISTTTGPSSRVLMKKWRRRLVLPATPFGPPDDVVLVCLAIAESGLLHGVLAHERKTPDHSVHGAAIHPRAVAVSGTLARTTALGGTTAFPAEISIPDEMSRESLRLGTSGNATAFALNAGVIGLGRATA